MLNVIFSIFFIFIVFRVKNLRKTHIKFYTKHFLEVFFHKCPGWLLQTAFKNSLENIRAAVLKKGCSAKFYNFIKKDFIEDVFL